MTRDEEIHRAEIDAIAEALGMGGRGDVSDEEWQAAIEERAAEMLAALLKIRGLAVQVLEA